MIDFYSKFGSVVRYTVFGDLVDQKETNAAFFLVLPNNENDPKEPNHIKAFFYLNVVYVYSLIRYIMERIGKNLVDNG